MTTETAIERGRRFAAWWEQEAVAAEAAVASAEDDWACELEGGTRDDIGYAGQAYGEATERPKLLRTRARWLRHAVLAMEERERLEQAAVLDLRRPQTVEQAAVLDLRRPQTVEQGVVLVGFPRVAHGFGPDCPWVVRWDEPRRGFTAIGPSGRLADVGSLPAALALIGDASGYDFNRMCLRRIEWTESGWWSAVDESPCD